LDLIRLVLLEVEKNNEPTRAITVTVDDYSEVQVQYHVKLLTDAGYLVSQNRSTVAVMNYRPKSLTWKGHDFLESTRSATVWNRVKTKLAEMGTDAPLSVVQQLAMKYVKDALGLGGE
jgi:hypothetical protein